MVSRLKTASNGWVSSDTGRPTDPRSITMSSFQISALQPDLFNGLFNLDPLSLAAREMTVSIADGTQSHPCRISLIDAKVGEEVLLLPYQHQSASTPYRSSGPIFVRRGAVQACLEPNTLPEGMFNRLMSLRAYNASHRIVLAEVCEGDDIARWLHRAFEDASVAYIHMHFARYGCYFCRADRA